MNPLVIGAMASLLLLAGCTGTRPQAGGAGELMEADREFAEAAKAHGYPKAFDMFLADESLSLPEGKDVVRGRKNIIASLGDGTEATLAWAPEAGDISRCGDLGYTWGYYTLTIRNGKTIRGKYMTVWKRQPDGAWKVALDGGSSIQE